MTFTDTVKGDNENYVFPSRKKIENNAKSFKNVENDTYLKSNSTNIHRKNRFDKNNRTSIQIHQTMPNMQQS